MYGTFKAPKQNTFPELGNLGEALFRGLGQQYMQDRAKLNARFVGDNPALDLADMAETATVVMLAGILPTPDRSAMEDIVAAAMSVDHLPTVMSDRRIQEGIVESNGRLLVEGSFGS